MTTAQALEQKIRTAIPLSAAMQFSIKVLNQDEIQVSAPLEPNINVHGTGFAGSIYSAAILTGWALCTHVMDELELGRDFLSCAGHCSAGMQVSRQCSTARFFRSRLA
jgi:thioesterase domain-containing protein